VQGVVQGLMNFTASHVEEAPHARSVTSLKFSADGKLLASASADKSVKLWDYANGSELKHSATLSGLHDVGVNDLAWHGDGTTLCVASDDKSLSLWDLRTREPINRLVGHTSYVTSCTFSSQSNQIVSGGFDETIRLWDVRRPERSVRSIDAHSDPVSCVDFCFDGTLIVSASYDGLCRIWDSDTGQCLKTIYAVQTPPSSCVTFSPNAKYILASTLDSVTRAWEIRDSANAVCVKQYKGHVNTKFCVVSDFLTSFEDQAYVISGSEDGSVFIWNTQTAKVEQQFKSHADPVLSIAAHKTEKLVVTGGMESDKTIRVFYHKTASE
jgi:COMPASS component SWD3